MSIQFPFNGPVLVVLDGSGIDGRSTAYALALARAARTRLMVLCADQRARTRTPVRSSLPKTFSQSKHDAFPQGIRGPSEWDGEPCGATLPTERTVLEEEFAPSILAEVERNQGNLLVLPFHTHDRAKGQITSSAGEWLLREASVPVLLVPTTCRGVPSDGRIRRIIVPLDGTPRAEEALGPAATLARAMASDVILVRVIEQARGAARYSLNYRWATQPLALEYLDMVARTLRADGVEAEMQAASGYVAPAIAAVAHKRGADLIVMATRAPRGFTRLLQGSFTIQTLRCAPVPVLVVPPGVAAKQLGSRAGGWPRTPAEPNFEQTGTSEPAGALNGGDRNRVISEMT